MDHFNSSKSNKNIYRNRHTRAQIVTVLKTLIDNLHHYLYFYYYCHYYYYCCYCQKYHSVELNQTSSVFAIKQTRMDFAGTEK